MPEAISEAHIAYEKDIAHLMRPMANEVSGKFSGEAPNIQISAVYLQQGIRKYYEDRTLSISPQAADVISLTENFASIL